MGPFFPFGRHGRLPSPQCEEVRVCGAGRRQQERTDTVVLTVRELHGTIWGTVTNTIRCNIYLCWRNYDLNKAIKQKRWALARREVSQKQSYSYSVMDLKRVRRIRAISYHMQFVPISQHGGTVKSQWIKSIKGFPIKWMPLEQSKESLT